MSKQINEANVVLNISDLNSSDMNTLSQILSLAGQAENSTTGATGPYQEISVQPEVSPMIQSDVQDLTLGDVEPYEEENTMDFDSDLDRISSLSGINPVTEMRLMPNLDLDEDAVQEMGSLGIGNNKMYGPYNSKLQAESEARAHIGGGQENINFKIITKPDGFYWSEHVSEDIERPEFTDVDTNAIRNSRHAVGKGIQKDGDNTMKVVPDCTCGSCHNCTSRESVETLHESLNQAYAKFLKK